MTSFWLLVALLLLAGAGFFVPVLLGRIRADAAERSRLNLLIHQQRRKELAAENPDGEQMAQLAAELDRDLLNDLDGSHPIALKPASAGRAALGLGLIASVLLGLALYFQLGRVDLLEAPRPAGETAAGPADLAARIEQLAKRLANDPDDLEGWVLLGRSLQTMGQAERAATAYEFALKLAPEDADLKAFYAQALAEAHQGSLKGKPTEIIGEILEREPEHPTGLWLAGLAAAERRDTGKAVEYWRKLKSLLPPGGEDRQAIDRYIAQVQGQAPPEASGQDPPTSGASIRVKVTLAEALKDRASPDDAVFVFARAASGPPMPLAVVRKKVRDLPLEVTLDDSIAMMPERKLSSFDRIVIGARVSKSGRPIPSSGDLQGLSPPLPSQSTPSQTVEIREIVP